MVIMVVVSALVDGVERAMCVHGSPEEYCFVPLSQVDLCCEDMVWNECMASEVAV
jgi:hypothetical protein